ncbi:MAG: hypothetical protein CMH54_11360 [Myxococcales bacterium]|nr:hypothetical protein [Myxococcales bacterium]
MTVQVSFKNLLMTLGSDKRSGQVMLETEKQSAVLHLMGGKVIRAIPGTGSRWVLGDILEEVQLLPRYKQVKIESEAQTTGELPEELLIKKKLISSAVLKRFQDRLTIRTVLSFDSDETVNAQLEAIDEDEVVSYEWDAEFPAAYLVRELDRRQNALSRINIEVPNPEDRFEKKPGIAQSILGYQFEAGEQDDTGLSQDARRVFFFCNGTIRFETLPIVTGIRLEEAAALIHQLKTCGAIQPIQTPIEADTRDWVTDNIVVLATRVSTIILAILFIGLTAISTLGLYGSATSTPLFPASHPIYEDSLEMVLSEHLNALNVYWHQHKRYPANASTLVDNGLMRKNSLNGRGIHGLVAYNTTHGGRGFDLAISMGDRQLQVSWAEGQPFMSLRKPADNPQND